MGLLDGKNIIVIGGTNGIGLSAAQAFLREGARVVVVGRKQESADQAKEILGDGAASFFWGCY